MPKIAYINKIFSSSSQIIFNKPIKPDKIIGPLKWRVRSL